MRESQRQHTLHNQIVQFFHAAGVEIFQPAGTGELHVRDINCALGALLMEARLSLGGQTFEMCHVGQQFEELLLSVLPGDESDWQDHNGNWYQTNCPVRHLAHVAARLLVI